MDKLEKILNKWGISLYDQDGRERYFITVLDEIYIKLNRENLLILLDEIELNSADVFGEFRWRR